MDRFGTTYASFVKKVTDVALLREEDTRGGGKEFEAEEVSWSTQVFKGEMSS